MIGAPVNALAKNAQASAERRVFAGEARPGADVGKIENEIVDRIGVVFERGCDRQTFAGLEKRKGHSAARGCSVWRHQTKLSPSVSGRVGDDGGEIML